MNTIDFNGMASKYGLDAAFVQSLHEKIVDKENFARAVRMFVNGTLPYDVAMGDAPINIAELRHQVAQNLLVFRKHKAEKVYIRAIHELMEQGKYDQVDNPQQVFHWWISNQNSKEWLFKHNQPKLF